MLEIAALHCLTLASLAISSGDEAHVTFTAETPRQVQTVAIVTQVAVFCTLIAVCNSDHTHTESINTHYTHICALTYLSKSKNVVWDMSFVCV